jgi:hypothetical protein
MLRPLLAALLMQGDLSPASPAAGYWQQQVRYHIRASLNDASGVLAGTQRMWYTNRSPDTLTTVAFHLHLNAFRPGSRWSDADSAERRRRFNDLREPDQGFNHVRNVRIMDVPVEPVWPFAPDSTIVRFVLPRPLAPGDSMVVDLEWDARPSTIPRRQGRRGRHLDFAHSYPKVVVYDRYGWNEQPLYPAGEFYGEFATYLVELDVARDQVMGATGVPICGDPGWIAANQAPDKPVVHQRDFYPNAPTYEAREDTCAPGGAEPPSRPLAPLGAEPLRKTVVWYAEDVHHFAFSLDPEYRYEGGRWGDVVIHVLYRPGDEASWGTGIAVTRTARALEWLDGFFGPFAWPQITNLHRLDGGGTEFPMMMHNGSAGQGLILHELGHNYAMGILANNEWREGWLDEGFTSFQTSLFFEAQQPGLDTYRQDEAFLTGLDLDGRSEPASLVSHRYRDFNTYNVSIYARGEQFFHQLRYLVGDEQLRRITRTFYRRWRLKHVDEIAFRQVAEEVSGMPLATFFGEGLHGTALVDYAVGDVETRRTGDTGWTTRVEILRKAEGGIPVEVWVVGETDTAIVRTDGLAEREWVTVATRSRPRQVLLDPRLRTRDWNMLNNVWRRGWLWPSREPKVEHYFDTWFSQRTARDHRTQGWMPVAWYNDAAGITLGIRMRSDYFGRFAQEQSLHSYGTGWESDREVQDWDFWQRIGNPTWLRSPGLSQQLDVYNVEGRFGGRLSVERTRYRHLGWGPVWRQGVTLTWLQPDDFRYLDRGYYDDAGTVELALTGGVTDQRREWSLATQVTAGGGLAYHRDGLLAATGRQDLDPYYGRLTVEATARRRGGRWGFGARFYGGVATSGSAVAKQRQIYVAGADPIQQFANPFLRSDGALLVRPDVHYHAPGGGNLRGYDPRLSAEGLVAVNLEMERMVVARQHGKLFRRIAIAGFGDAGHTIGEGGSSRFLADAGLGLRAEHMIGQTRCTTRADFPLFVSRPRLAQNRDPGTDAVGFRWSFSFSPAF